MAVKVKPIAIIKQKYEENAGRAAQSCADRASAAADDWAKNTEAAAENFHAAISATGIKERFKSGVRKSGASKYKDRVEALTADRYKRGIEVGADDYASNVAPMLDTIAALTLPARKPKGDPDNIKRVEKITTALHAKRLALLGIAASH